MIRKSLYALAVATGAMAFASQADAAFLDFVGQASLSRNGTTSGDYGGVFDGTTILSTKIPIATTFSGGPGTTGATCASDGAGGCTGDFAYFDDLFGGKDGGLGVATVTKPDPATAAVNVPILQATPSSDDNVSAMGTGDVAEWVRIAFSGPLSLSGFSFNDANHNAYTKDSTGTTILYGIDLADGTAPTLDTTIGDLIGGTSNIDFSSVTSLTLGFDDDSSRNGDQFYVGGLTAVPIPAALPLFGTALAGLGIFGWRKRKAGTA